MTQLFLQVVALVALVGCSTGAGSSSTAATLQASEPATRPATQPATRPVSRWEPTIAAFEEMDRENPPPQNGVLFIGSSSIRGWRSVGEDFPNLPVINRGFGGSTIADVNEFADRIVLPYRPRTIVLYAGDNDVAGGLSPQQVFADFRQFVSTVHDELPQTRIIFLSIKPSEARWKHQEQFEAANALVQQYTATDERLEYVDVATPMLGENGRPRPELYIGDRLHMTPAGYELWAETLRPVLEEVPMQP